MAPCCSMQPCSEASLQGPRCPQCGARAAVGLPGSSLLQPAALSGPDAVRPLAGSLMYAHDAELERQWASLDGITADALEESRINWELAGVICARMDASRRSTERLLGVLQVGRTCMPPGLGLPQGALAACTPQPGTCQKVLGCCGDS